MRWGTPTPGRIAEIAANLRLSDQQELLAAGHDPVQELYASVRCSNQVAAILGDDGEPVGVAGVNGETIWLLGTDGLTATASHRLQLTRGARKWIKGLRRSAAAKGEKLRLCNWAYAKNLRSLRWLKSLGFTVHPPCPCGKSGTLFSFFVMEG